MLVIDKRAMTRLARYLRAGLAARRIPVTHSLAFEGAAAALGFTDSNAISAFLARRPLVVGIPRDPYGFDITALLSREPDALQVAAQVARAIGAVADLAGAALRLGVCPRRLSDMSDGRAEVIAGGYPVSGDARWTVVSGRARALRSWTDAYPARGFPPGIATELTRLENLDLELGMWEDGTVVTPDIPFLGPDMADGLRRRVLDGAAAATAAATRTLSAACWREVWYGTFVPAVAEPDGSGPGMAAAAVVAAGMVGNEGRGPWRGRWSRADLEMCLLASRARSAGPPPPSPHGARALAVLRGNH